MTAPFAVPFGTSLRGTFQVTPKQSQRKNHMPPTFQLEILTPEKTFYAGDVTSLVIPGTDGFFGVLAHHAPLIAKSNGGKLKIRETSDQERFFRLGPGIVEVLPARFRDGKNDRVVILTRRAENFSA
jgi:F-type H+-transporting ATPase subunit epsilon